MEEEEATTGRYISSLLNETFHQGVDENKRRMMNLTLYGMEDKIVMPLAPIPAPFR